GVTPYSYIWSNGTTTEDLAGLAAGSYTVTVTDANQCTATESVVINDASGPTLTEGTSPVNCNGGADGSADLTVNGGVSPYSYIWSNGTTTEDLTGLAAGSYTVTVTDANQCTATISVLVTEPLAGLTSLTVPANTTCGLDNGVIDLTVNGGVTPYSYIWSNGTTTEDLTGLAAGSYTVTVTDANQCTATESVVIDDSSVPTFTFPDITECDGVPIVLNGNPAGGVYSIPNPYTGPSTTYTYTYTDANGCTATATGTITINPLPNTSPIFHD
ncbi:MAG: SprB repeat-containing protein, partial [Bacteroidota bacterium]